MIRLIRAFNEFSNVQKVYMLVFVVFWLFFLLAPMTGDDFTWANYYLTLKDRGDIFASFLHLHQNVNGRILGNALEFFLINHLLISSMFRSLVMTGIVVLISKIYKIKSGSATSIIALVLFLPGITIFRQAIAWSAGFYNYTVPILLILLLYYLVTTNRRHRMIYVALAVFASATSLFAENVTLVSLVISVLLMMINFRFHFVQSSRLITVVIGLFVGAVLMFSSPVYARVAAGEDSYRTIGGQQSISNDGFLVSVINNSHNLVQYLVFDILHVYALLLLVCVVAIVSKRSSRKGGVNKSVNVSVGFMFGAFSVLFICEKISITAPNIYQYIYTGALVVLFLLYLLSFIYFIFAFVENKKQAYVPIGLILSAILYVSPMLVITPFGPRNFYLPYVILSLLILHILLSFCGEKYKRFVLNTESSTIYYGVLFITLAMLSIFASTKYIDVKNSYETERQLEDGSTTIVLRRYPFSDLLHDGESTDKRERFVGRYVCDYTDCSYSRKVTVVYK